MKVAKSTKGKGKTPEKVNDQELKQLQENYTRVGQAIEKLGELEVQKQYVLRIHSQAEAKLGELRSSLKEKYGSVNVDINTGEIKPVDNESENAKN